MICLFLIGIIIALTGFAIVWAISLRAKNYGFLDVAWSYSIAVLACLYAACGPGYAPRRFLIATVGTVWSIRLGTHVLLRVLRHHPSEDPRYRSLRQQWSGPFMFFLFFELQAVIAAILSLPFLLMSFNPGPGLTVIEIIGCVLALLALTGEAIADSQIKAFAATPGNAGKVCQTGLWRYSRHPNYFFESMVWWGFFIAALGSPWGWTTIVAPMLMLWFLLKVTGIPLTELHSLEKRGEAYREYQRTTSAFIPWFPKRNTP